MVLVAAQVAAMRRRAAALLRRRKRAQTAAQIAAGIDVPESPVKPKLRKSRSSKIFKERPKGFWKYQPEVYDFYSHSKTQIFVAVLIMANFFSNIAEKQWDPAGTLFRPTFQTLEDAFNLIFAVELVVNMYANWLCRFWKSSWNVFDFVVVCVGMVSLSFFNVRFPEPLKLLRILRALRVFRLFKRVKSLNKIIKSLALAVPGTCNAFVVLFLFLTIFALLGVEFFKDFGTVRAEPGGPGPGRGFNARPTSCDYANLHRPWRPPFFYNASDPDDPVINALNLYPTQLERSTVNMSSWDEFDLAQYYVDPLGKTMRKAGNAPTVSAETTRGLCFGEDYFQTFTLAWYTLFQVLTTESWSEAIGRPLQFNWVGSVDAPFPIWLAWPISSGFFMMYVVLMFFFLMNVVIGVLLDKFISAGQNMKDEEDADSDDDDDVVPKPPEEKETELKLQAASKFNALIRQASAAKETPASPPPSPAAVPSSDFIQQVAQPCATVSCVPVSKAPASAIVDLSRTVPLDAQPIPPSPPPSPAAAATKAAVNPILKAQMARAAQSSMFRARHNILARKIDDCSGMIHSLMTELVKRGKLKEAVLRQYEHDIAAANQTTPQRSRTDSPVPRESPRESPDLVQPFRPSDPPSAAESPRLLRSEL